MSFSQFSQGEAVKKILNLENFSLSEADILSVSDRSSRAFNVVYEVKTKKGQLFFKQFLNKARFPFPISLKTPAQDRLRHTLAAQKIYSNILGKSRALPKIYGFSENDTYLITEGFNGKTLLEKIKTGRFKDLPARLIARILAEIHLKSDKMYSKNTSLYNEEVTEINLRFRYYEAAKLVSSKEKDKIIKLAKSYKQKREVLVHGDFCSVNILQSNNDSDRIRIIDLEDVHVGAPEYDLGTFLSEYFIALTHFPKQKKIIQSKLCDFISVYFEIFKSRRNKKELELLTTLHTATLMIYNTFGAGKNIFTPYITEASRRLVMREATAMLNSPQPISRYIHKARATS